MVAPNSLLGGGVNWEHHPAIENQHAQKCHKHLKGLLELINPSEKSVGYRHSQALARKIDERKRKIAGGSGGAMLDARRDLKITPDADAANPEAMPPALDNLAPTRKPILP